jgi:hypothetical protein
MHVHVFAIDILPFEHLVCSGGGMRSWQFIHGLRQLGADVTYSMPTGTSLIKQQWEQLTAEQRENCYGPDKGRRITDLINKFKPDVAVVLWPLAFSSTSNLKEGMITVVDLNGFQNVEAALFSRADFQAETKRYLRKIGSADILVTGSSQQRAYWGGLLGYHRDSLGASGMLDVPFCPDSALIEAAAGKPYRSDGPLFFCTGTFLPWNSPQGHLIRLARRIAEAGRGELLVVGRPLLSEPYSGEVLEELDTVARFPFARIVSGMPFSSMVETITRRGVSIDLHLPTLEREFALPVRTMSCLGLGMPVIFNNYSTLAAQVDKYKAGFCIDVSNHGELENVIDRILSAHNDGDLARMSDAAIRLVQENYCDHSGMQRLYGRMEEKLTMAKARCPRPAAKPTAQDDDRAANLRSPFIARIRLPRVLVISDEPQNMLDVRVHLPFRAMQREHLIEDYVLMAHGELVKGEHSAQQPRDVDVVWVQRRPSTLLAPVLFGDRFILDLDDNLLISPSYRPPFAHEWVATLRMLLRTAGTVTTTGPRLVDAIQRHSGVTIEHKAIIAPNMTASVHSKCIVAPNALLLACSDHLPLTHSKHAFLRAVRRFTDLRGLPLLYIGASVNEVDRMARDIHQLETLPYPRYLEVLRSQSLMAVVPLEAHGDPLTDDFICSKSDIKMVEFGAASVPAVYSRVAPYSDSALRIGPLADFSDANAVIESLDLVFTDAARHAKLAYESVRDQRLASAVVHQWHEAIDRQRLATPVALEFIQTQAARYEQFLAGSIPRPAEFDERNYAASYPEAVAWAKSTGQTVYAHYLRYGRPEGRRWHIGDPDVRIEQTARSVQELISSLDRDWTALSERAAAALGERRPESAHLPVGDAAHSRTTADPH